LGPGWSTTSNTPFRYHKTWTHEGGTATPLIVHWTNGIEARGQLRHGPAHVIDVWPTIVQLAGATDRHLGQPAKPGISLVDSLAKDSSAERTLWWSHEGNRALRHGAWKISAAGAEGSWELYHVGRDRTETNDISAANPGKLDQLRQIWNEMNDRHTRLALGGK
jgi:arylsulfatase